MTCPEGFNLIKLRDQKGRSIKYLQCSKVQYNNSLKKYIQCSFKIRKDHFLNSNHTHIFKNTIQNYFNIPTDQSNQNDIQEKIFNFVGNSNISINTVCSLEFYSLIETIFEMGKKIQKNS